MKKIKGILLLFTAIIGLLSVSCSDEETIEEKDERLVGVWEKVYEPQSHINFNIDAQEQEYYQQILNTMILKEGVLDHILFGDTIQFFEKGLFSESGNLLEEEAWDSAVDYYPAYKVVNGEEIFINQPLYSYTSKYGNRRATYEFIGDDLLILTVEYTDEYHLLRLSLEQSNEYEGKVIRSLQVDRVNYTQTYRKISDIPYQWE